MDGMDVVTRVGDRVLSLSNLDKVLFPETGYTKAEVINYYSKIASVLLPHISDRALTRLRFPDGVGEQAFSFYEKNAPMGTPDWVRRVLVDTGEERIDYVVADDAADCGLAGQPGCAGAARAAVDGRQRHCHGTGWSTWRTPSRGRASRWPTGSWSTSTPERE